MSIYRVFNQRNNSIDDIIFDRYQEIFFRKIGVILLFFLWLSVPVITSITLIISDSLPGDTWENWVYLFIIISMFQIIPGMWLLRKNIGYSVAFSCQWAIYFFSLFMSVFLGFLIFLCSKYLPVRSLIYVEIMCCFLLCIQSLVFLHSHPIYGGLFFLAFILPIVAAMPNIEHWVIYSFSVGIISLFSIFYISQRLVKSALLFRAGEIVLEDWQKEVLWSLNDGLIITCQTQVLFVNAIATNWFSLSTEALGTQELVAILGENILNKISQQGTFTSMQSVEIEYCSSTQRKYDFLISCYPLSLKVEKEVGSCFFLWKIIDRTECKKQLDELNVQKIRYLSIIESSQDMLFYLNSDGQFLYLNARGVLRTLGRPVNQIIGTSLYTLLEPEVVSYFSKELQKIHIVSMQREGTIQCIDGKKKIANIHLFPMRDSLGTLVSISGMVTDISLHKQAEDHVLYLAMHDDLTGLPNRRFFQESLQQAWDYQFHQKKSLLVLYALDLDKFKEVNDSLGHDVGDHVLEVTAHRLRASVHVSDTVARLGGDEFSILVQSILRIEDILAIAKRIVESIGSPIFLGDHTIQVYASVGVAVYPIDNFQSMAELIEGADAAMYHAKSSGCNCYKLTTGDDLAIFYKKYEEWKKEVEEI